jgi:hypothetical protein
MAQQFKQGDRVRCQHEFRTGTVVKVSKTRVEVNWDEDKENYDVAPNELVLLDEMADRIKAAEVQDKIDMATNALELAFKAWAEAIEEYDGSKYALKNNPLLDVSKCQLPPAQGWWLVSSFSAPTFG